MTKLEGTQSSMQTVNHLELPAMGMLVELHDNV